MLKTNMATAKAAHATIIAMTVGVWIITGSNGLAVNISYGISRTAHFERKPLPTERKPS